MSQGDNIPLFNRGEKYLLKGQTALQKKKFKQARELLGQALRIFEDTGALIKGAETYFLLGRCAENEKHHSEARELFLQSYNARLPLGNSIQLVEVAIKIALGHLTAHQFTSAHEYAQKAIDINEQIANQFLKPQAFKVKGDIFFEEGDFSTALFYYGLASESLPQGFSSQLDIALRENMGMAYAKTGRFRDSSRHLLTPLRNHEKQRHYAAVVAILQQMATNSMEMGDNAQALSFIQDALHIHAPIAAMLPAKMTLSLFEVAIEVHKVTHNFEAAEETCERAIEIAETKGNPLKPQLGKFLLEMVRLDCIAGLADPEKQTEVAQYLAEVKGIYAETPAPNLGAELLAVEILINQTLNQAARNPGLLEEGMTMAENAQDPLLKGMVHKLWGHHCYAARDYERAAEHFTAAADSFLQHSNYIELSECYYNIACCSSLLHIPDTLIENLRKAVEFSPKYRAIARSDPDFQGLEAEPLFQRLIAVDENTIAEKD